MKSAGDCDLENNSFFKLKRNIRGKLGGLQNEAKKNLRGLYFVVRLIRGSMENYVLKIRSTGASYFSGPLKQKIVY